MSDAFLRPEYKETCCMNGAPYWRACLVYELNGKRPGSGQGLRLDNSVAASSFSARAGEGVNR